MAEEGEEDMNEEEGDDGDLEEEGEMEMEEGEDDDA